MLGKVYLSTVKDGIVPEPECVRNKLFQNSIWLGLGLLYSLSGATFVTDVKHS